jgi:hypothetical protein
MTELEKLRSQLNQIVDAIIIEAKKQNTAFVPSLSSTVTPTVTTTPSKPTPAIEKIDLLAHILSNFDNLIKDKKEKNLISSFTMTPIKWTRNINCWAKDLDLTGTSCGIWGLGGVGGGTLITKKHVLLANHVPYPSLPATIYFVDKNNNSYEYKIIKTKQVVNTDILIGELDREADASLKVYKVLPTNYLKYFNKEINFPILYSDQERKALIGENGLLNTTYGSTNTLINISKDSNRAQYFEPLIVGDSGNLVSTIINNEIVVIGGWYMTLGNMAGLATNIPNYLNEVNSTIVSLTPGYKLNEVDLSNFRQY